MTRDEEKYKMKKYEKDMWCVNGLIWRAQSFDHV